MSVVRLHTDEILDNVGTDIDVFICCGSYEERCKSVAEAIDVDRVRSAIVGWNTNLEAFVYPNTSSLLDRFGEKAVECHLDSSNPITTSDALKDSLEAVIQGDRAQCVLVDVTTFTHESLLILVKLLQELVKPHDTPFFVYTSAEEYSVGLEDEDKWLSKGVADVRSVLGYPGRTVPSLPTHLVVLTGYEHDRALRLIEVFEPDYISLGFGKPGTATSKKHQDANEHFCRLLEKALSFYERQAVEFTFSCCEPIDAKAAILEVARARDRSNVVVAPMNTKMSTLGAALAVREDESIQICYAQAEHYNFGAYSSPAKNCSLFTLDELF
jgi:hypothetical protein